MSLIPRSFFFDDDFDSFFFPTNRVRDMKCDIYEKDNTYFIEIDLPGFNKEDIKIDLKDKYLTVTASRNEEKKEDDKNYIRRERSYGHYSRSFSLGDITEDDIDAKFENGTLLITVKKKEEIESKKTIEIN
ncbi:MAG TPA: Hsp20/alpha crystallin family protein [Mollicutes bacterium]|nr:Hsp20/alpha crystallin family protein [Mollicutes bacterium]